MDVVATIDCIKMGCTGDANTALTITFKNDNTFSSLDESHPSTGKPMTITTEKWVQIG